MRNRHRDKKINLRNRILLPVAALILGACNGQTVYHAFRDLPTEGWQRTDTVDFKVAVPDSFTTYNLYVEVRNNDTYPYQNLNLSISSSTADTLHLSADTLQLTLADPQGNWTGKGWSGLYQSAFPAGAVPIRQAGIYRFQIAYTLPDKSLKGISDIGIKLERRE